MVALNHAPDLVRRGEVRVDSSVIEKRPISSQDRPGRRPCGASKSTVGAALAERLGWDFRDVDALIAERAGKPVAEIFADHGEPAFRAYEEATTAELLAEPGVLALGGGAVLSAKTRSALAGRRVVPLG